MQLLQIKKFNWKELLLGSEEWNFLPEVGIRTLIMFTIILIGLEYFGQTRCQTIICF